MRKPPSVPPHSCPEPQWTPTPQSACNLSSWIALTPIGLPPLPSGSATPDFRPLATLIRDRVGCQPPMPLPPGHWPPITPHLIWGGAGWPTPRRSSPWLAPPPISPHYPNQPTDLPHSQFHPQSDNTHTNRVWGWQVNFPWPLPWLPPQVPFGDRTGWPTIHRPSPWLVLPPISLPHLNWGQSPLTNCPQPLPSGGLILIEPRSGMATGKPPTVPPPPDRPSLDLLIGAELAGLHLIMLS